MVHYLKTSVGELAASKDWKYFIHGMGWVMADQKQTNYQVRWLFYWSSFTCFILFSKIQYSLRKVNTNKKLLNCALNSSKSL